MELASRYYYLYDDFGDKHYFLGGDHVSTHLIGNDILPYIKFGFDSHKPDEFNSEIIRLREISIILKRKICYINSKIEELKENAINQVYIFVEKN